MVCRVMLHRAVVLLPMLLLLLALLSVSPQRYLPNFAALGWPLLFALLRARRHACYLLASYVGMCALACNLRRAIYLIYC